MEYTQFLVMLNLVRGLTWKRYLWRVEPFGTVVWMSYRLHIFWILLARSLTLGRHIEVSNNTRILNSCTRLCLTELEQVTPCCIAMIKIYLLHFILERVAKGLILVMCEMRVGDGTDCNILIPSSSDDSSTSSSFCWVAQPEVTEGRKPLSQAGSYCLQLQLEPQLTYSN